MSGRKKKKPVDPEPQEPTQEDPESEELTNPSNETESEEDINNEEDSGSSDTAEDVRKMVEELTAELAKVKTALSKERRRRSAGGGRWREQFLNSLKPYDGIEPIEEFLRSFERYMKGAEVEQDDWSLHLVPLLRGDARRVSNQLNDDCSYEDVKRSLLEYYQVRPDTYRRRLRKLTWRSGRDVGKFCKDAGFLAKKWLESAKDSTEICEWIAVEQIAAGLPSDVARWLREKEPTNSKEAETLLRQYQFLREDNQRGARLVDRRRSDSPGPKEEHNEGHSSDQKQKQRGRQRTTKDVRELECYKCHRKGHFARDCPDANLLGEESRKERRPTFCCSGEVNGQPADEMRLDTGATRTGVHGRYVPESDRDHYNTVTMTGMLGKPTKLPTAEVDIATLGQQHRVTAAVVDDLPVDAMLGKDLPLLDLIAEHVRATNDTPSIEEDALIATRAQSRQMAQQAELQQAQEATSGCQPTPWEDLARIDDDLIEPAGKTRVRMSRGQRREHNQLRVNPLPDVMSIQQMQEEDEELQKVVREDQTGRFSKLRGAWVRSWKTKDGQEIQQLLLPKPLRGQVLEVAHQIPLAGHMGKDRTAA